MIKNFNNVVTDKGVNDFIMSKHCEQLRDLAISMNYPKIGDKSLLAIAISENLRNLKIL